MKLRLYFTTFMIASALFFLLTACNNEPEQPASISSQPPIETTAVKLLADYEADEAAASQFYGGRNLVITGAVMSITKNSDGSAVILLNSPQSSIGSVRCHFPAEKAAALAQVQRQDSIIVKGVCANMDSHIQVVVKECNLTSTAEEVAAYAGKPKDHPYNIKAMDEIGSDLTQISSFISDAGILYVSVTKETENLDAYAKKMRRVLEKHGATVRWVKIIEFDTADPSNPDNAFGKLLAEERW